MGVGRGEGRGEGGERDGEREGSLTSYVQKQLKTTRCSRWVRSVSQVRSF